MNITATRKIEFDAGHRIIGHENKCKYLHGHRYILEVTFRSPKLDKLGRVIDFGEVKKILGDWIEDNFDHNVLLNKEDKELGGEIELITGQKIYYFDYNPTAENIARYLYAEVLPELFRDKEIEFVSVKVWETPNCYSIASK